MLLVLVWHAVKLFSSSTIYHNVALPSASCSQSPVLLVTALCQRSDLNTVCCQMQVQEEDLAVLVGEAATFVEKERARANKRARRHRDGRPRSVCMGKACACIVKHSSFKLTCWLSDASLDAQSTD